MTQDSTNEPALDMFDLIWAPGSHSLCAQVNGSPFRTIGHFDDPHDLVAAARELGEEANVWWGIHAMDPPAKGRGGAEHVTAVCTLAADFDWADPDAHKGTDLPTEMEVRLTVSTMVPQPTIVVNSGHGLQAYWGMFDEIDAATAERLSDGFFRYIEDNYGLRNDRKDLASVLRLPGTFNNKAEPVEVMIEQMDATVAYHSDDLFEHYWTPPPVTVLPTPSFHVERAKAAHPSRQGEESPIEWAKENFSVYDHLLRQGWQEGHSRGNEVQLTRPGKDPRNGTSATCHRDKNIVNIYSTSVDPLYAQVGHHGNGVITLNGFDCWMAENGYTDRSDASREIRRTQMPQAPSGERRADRISPDDTPGAVVDELCQADASTGLNLPPEFWEARPVLTQIRDAAWSMKVAPDAVFASVLTRYSADLHPSIQLPEWGTLDLFVVIAGPSGRFKSKASKTARRLYPGRGDRQVMHDYNVGSGEAVAETFFEWLDEDGNVCSPSKKGARKVLTKWGLHFSTDEGEALTASAGRMNSILIPTLCAAWMGEGIGQVLADPTKSRMIPPHTVRVSAEVKIQTVNGWKLFAEAYASTGLAQRMLCFSSIDPTVRERGEAGIDPPPWPGQLDLPYPFTLTNTDRVMDLASEIRSHLDRKAWEGHDYEIAGSPLDTHADLSRLKVAGILALWEDRFSIEPSDWELAGQVLDSSRTVRTTLRATKAQADRDASHSRNMAEADRAVVVDDAKHRALVRRTVEAIQARLDGDKPLGKKYFSGPQREVYEEAMHVCEQLGLVEEAGKGWRQV